MKDIMMRIVGRQIADGQENEEKIEFITEGRCCRKDDAVYLLYEESELSGMKGCTTSLKIQDDKVEMRRFGSGYRADTEIAFEKGKHFKGYYDTPVGTLEMEVLTREIINELRAEEGKGRLSIDYRVSLKGLSQGRSRLDIELM